MYRTYFLFDILKNWLRGRKRRDAEAGQSIILMVLGVVGLLAFAGLVFDGGTAYAQFRRMQNAADAGAMAGANELSKKNTPDGTTNGAVCATVLNYAHSLNGMAKYPDWQTDARVQVQYIIPNPSNPGTYQLKPVPGCHPNGGSEGNPSGKPRDDAKGVRVTTSTTFDTFFLKMVGLGTGTSVAHASAEYGPASPLNVQPLAKRCPDTDPPCDLRIGIYQEIWQSSEPGNLGWLGFNGDTNTPNMRQEFDPNAPLVPYIDDMTMVDGVPRTPCRTIGLGCWVQGSTGVANTLEDYIEGLWAGADKRPLIIVLYDRQLEGGANTEYHIVGFAAFKLDKLDLSGNEFGYKSMWGTFERWMDSSAICDDCADTGLYSVRLIPDVVEPPPPIPTKGRICATVAYDVGVDGGFDATTDYYLAGATVTIKDSGGNTKDSWNTLGMSTNCTDAIFDPGTYTVIETNPPGYVSDPNPPYANGADTRSVGVAAGGTTDVLFLDYWTDVGNIVVLTRDSNNAVLPSLAAILKPASNPSWIVGGPTKSTTGTVYFRNRPPGNYIVSGMPGPGYDMMPAYDNVPAAVTVGSVTTVTIKAIKYATGKICVHVWDDEDVNGVYNPPPTGNDKSLWGSIITLAGTANATHTMGDGEIDYCFENLRLGPYTVSQSHPPGYSSVPGSPDSWAGTLTTDGQVVNLNFRDHIPPRGNVCVEVFDDVTGDGLATPGEVNIGGATIYMFNMLDLNTPVVSYVTNGTEPKCFSVLVGNYRVQEVANPPGYLSTTPDIRDNIGIAKDSAVTVQFGDRTHAPTSTPTRTRTPTPTRTNTPPSNTTPTPTPTRTKTPIPGALCLTVYDDLNTNGNWDHYPAGTPTPTGTPSITPEPLLAPKKVDVTNSSSVLVKTWDGTGVQPCWADLWPDSYGVTETDPQGYSSTTGNNVTALVTSNGSITAEFGDKLCFASPPHMRDPIFISGQQWMLQWDNLPGTFYTIYASGNSIDPDVPTWTAIGEASDINYYVERNQGPNFYVVATDNCGTSGPSNVVTLPSG